MSEEFDGGSVLPVSRRFRSWRQDGARLISWLHNLLHIRRRKEKVKKEDPEEEIARVVFWRGLNVPSRYNRFYPPCFKE